MTDLGISKLVLAMQLNGFICYIPNSNSLFRIVYAEIRK